MDRRRAQVAENEVRFRHINERLGRALQGVVEAEEPVEFVCECGHARCTDPVPVTAAQYERVREDARDFLVMAGHEIPDAEAVIARCRGYNVVRKDGEAASYAREHDPRG